MAKFKAPETGIELLVGEPGAGKSLFAVQRMIQVMREQRRPVYTNLPLRWRVFRAYLRTMGGEKLADLLRPLSEDHFRRFIERFEGFRAFKDELKARDRGIRVREVRERWLRERGPDTFEGDGANWIPPGAVVVIDEVQHWFTNPALKIGNAKPEPQALMSYLTMHRHLMHWVWFATQRERQISTTIKALAHRIWQIRRRDNDKLVWGIQFKHLGVKALGYRAFRPEDDPEKDEPHQVFTAFPWLPWNQVYFRLYDSFTHAGSKRQLREGLRQARMHAGLNEKGLLESEVNRMAKKSGVMRRLFFGTIKFGMFLMALLLVLAVGVWAGGEGMKQRVSGAAVGENKKVIGERIEWDRSPRAVSVSPRGVVFDGGELVKAGGIWRDLQLMGVRRDGICVWRDVHNDDVWLCEVGESVRRLGTIRAVTAALTARSTADRRGANERGGASAAGPAEFSGGMGASGSGESNDPGY